MFNASRRPLLVAASIAAAVLSGLEMGWAQAPATQSTEQTADPVTRYANAVLAQRFAGLARSTFDAGSPTPVSWQRIIALLAAAQKLDPTEASYPKLLAEARTFTGDTEGAIEALKAFRELSPSDQQAQITLIDLYTTRFPVAEKRLQYLKDVVDAKSVPAEVRSYAALQAGYLHAERSQSKQAIAMYDEALRLNPLSPEALAARYEATAATDTPTERITMLLRMMQSNPAQPDRAAELANELASAGLGRASLDWYTHAVKTWNRMQTAPPHAFVVDYASQLLLVDRQEDADMLVQQMLTVDASDVDALLLRLLTLRAAGNKNELAVAMETTEGVLRGRVMLTRELDTPAATQPIQPLTSELPDLSADIAEAIKPENEARRRALVATLADLAWFEVYFAGSHEKADNTFALLAQLTDADSPLIARLTGWSLFLQGKTQEATVKLSAAADQDALAALGLAKLQLANDSSMTEGNTTARQVLGKAAAGLTGAIVWDGLRDQGIRRLADNSAELAIAQLDSFPKAWLNVVESPEQFYTVRGEPVRPSFGFGEPMFCRVTISNTGNYDITVGPNGLLKPDLWFDAQLRGLVQQQLSGVSYDRITETQVLRPKQSVTKFVRIDAGALNDVLTTNPTPSVQIFVSIVTNPTATGEKNAVGPGAGGTKAQVSRIFSRGPFPFNSEQARTQLLNTLREGAPADKFNALDLASTIAKSVLAEKPDEKNERDKQIASQLAGAVLQARSDAIPSIAAWAWRAAVTQVAQPTDSAGNVQSMLNSDSWISQLAGLLHVESALSEEARKTSLERLIKTDPDPVVKNYAQSILNASTKN